MKTISAIALIFMMLGGRPQAQITLLPPTRPVAPEISQAVLDLLTSSPPSDTHLYAITDVAEYEINDKIVSLVGISADLQPPYEWGLEDGNAIWLGTIKVRADGLAEYFDVVRDDPNSCHGCALANRATSGGAGGGPEIYFPWKSGTRMMYGVRAIHGSGDYGTSGMYAVDWVGGDNLGANVAPPTVYSSAAGEVSWVCRDDNNVTVKVDDGTNYFVYAHLVDKASLAIGLDIGRGQPFASLVYGSFSNDGCGWATQQSTNYHLHWMFVPDDGYYNAQGWVLSFADSKWHSGDNAVGVGQWMTGAGGTGYWPTDEDDPNNTGDIYIDPNNPDQIQMSGNHVWDFLIQGIYGVADGVIFSNLPTSYDSVGGGDPAGSDGMGGLGDPVATPANSWDLAAKSIVSSAIQTLHLYTVGVIWILPIFILLAFIFGGELLNIIYIIWRFILKIIPTFN